MADNTTRPVPSPAREGAGQLSRTASVASTVPADLGTAGSDSDIEMVQEPDVKETMDEIPSPSTVYYPEKRDQPGGEEKKSGGGLVEIPGPTNLGVDVTDVPDIADKTAPRFRKGQHHITPNAIRCRARRIFTPRANGTYKVSDDIYNEWHGKGQPRKNLEDIFRSCGYDPDSRWYWECLSCMTCFCL